jgi:cysteine desulfurase
MLPAARTALELGLSLWANPSSPHAEGRAARAALEEARARVKAALDWPGEVLFTSGASEALALALGRATVERRLVSAVEHDAVFRAAPDATVLPVVEGEVDLAALTQAPTASGRALVAVQHTNSETGTYLAHDATVDAIHAGGGLALCDAAQLGPGRSLPAGVDMAVISGHKLGAPVGIGALLVRDLAMLKPSGGQELGYRPGTENMPGALALAAALEQGEGAWQTSAEQRCDFKSRLLRNGEVVAAGAQCSHILALASPRFAARVLLMRLDALGFAVSAGSACASGSLKPSRVLAGFGIEPALAERTIRVSLGWSTTPADLDAFATAWEAIHA